jgi:hypothetical protein
MSHRHARSAQKVGVFTEKLKDGKNSGVWGGGGWPPHCENPVIYPLNKEILYLKLQIFLS